MKVYISDYFFLPTLKQLQKDPNFKLKRGQFVYDEVLKQIKCFDGETWLYRDVFDSEPTKFKSHGQLDYSKVQKCFDEEAWFCSDVFYSEPIKFKSHGQIDYYKVHSIISAYSFFLWFDFQQIFVINNLSTFKEIHRFVSGNISHYYSFPEPILQERLDSLSYWGLLSVSEKGYSLNKSAYETLKKIFTNYGKRLFFPSMTSKAEISNLFKKDEGQLSAEISKYRFALMDFQNTLSQILREEGTYTSSEADAIMKQEIIEFEEDYFNTCLNDKLWGMDRVLGTIKAFTIDTWQTLIGYHNKIGFLPYELINAYSIFFMSKKFSTNGYKGYLLNQQMITNVNKLVEDVIADYYKYIKKIDNSVFENLNRLIKSKTVDVYIPALDFDTFEETHNERTKIGGLPYLRNKNDWPTCKFCGIRQQLVFQLNSNDSLEYMDMENDLLQHFSCLNYRCKTEKSRLDENYQLKSDYFRSIKVRGASYIPPNEDKPKAKPIYIIGWKRMKRLPRLVELGDMELSRDEEFFLKKKLVNEIQYDVFSGKPYWNEYDPYSEIENPPLPLPLPPFCNYEDNDLEFLHQLYYKPNVLYIVFVFQHKKSKEYSVLWYS